MNKLLSSKVLALSMLALAVGESWGMNQNPPLNNSQTNMPQKIVVNLHPNVLLGRGGSINLKALVMLEKSPSYQWFSEKGVTFVKGINIICNELKMYAPDFMPNKGKHSKEAICNCLDRHWDKLSPIFDRVKILSANLHRPKSYETRKKKEELLGWDASSSESVKWAKQNNVDTHKDLLSLTLKAISLSGQKIDVNRCTKRDNLLLLKFLDDNWEVLQPFMGQAYAELQSPFLIQAPQPQSSARIPAAQPNWPVQQQHMYPLPFQLPIIQEAQIQTNQGDPIHECSIERLLNHH